LDRILAGGQMTWQIFELNVRLGVTRHSRKAGEPVGQVAKFGQGATQFRLEHAQPLLDGLSSLAAFDVGGCGHFRAHQG